MAAMPTLKSDMPATLSRRAGGFSHTVSRPGASALNAHLSRAPTQSTPRKGIRIPHDVVGAAMRGVDAFVAALICIWVLSLGGTAFFSATVSDLGPVLVSASLAMVALSLSGAWRTEYRMGQAWSSVRACLALAATVPVLIFTDQLFAVQFVGLAGTLLWGVLSLMHIVYGVLIHRLAETGRLSENIVIVGATENARRLIARSGKSRGLNIVGVFDDRLARAPNQIDGIPVLGSLDDLMGWNHLPEIDRIVVTVTSDARERVRDLVDRLRVLPQRVVLLLDLAGFDPETESLDRIAKSPAAYLSGAPVNQRRALAKRTIDLVVATLMSIVFAPVMAAIALGIWLEDRGPVFFRQRRHGFNNQIIRVWKFRSMHPDKLSEERMIAQTFAGDHRVTRLGRFIRRTSLDELPQLWNVLTGEMSIVGPRPHAVGMTTEQTDVHAIVRAYAHRHRVKPGITGWAQINGSRGPLHTKQGVRERVQLDLEYVNRTSLWFDLYIMLMTAPCLFGDRKNDR